MKPALYLHRSASKQRLAGVGPSWVATDDAERSSSPTAQYKGCHDWTRHNSELGIIAAEHDQAQGGGGEHADQQDCRPTDQRPVPAHPPPRPSRGWFAIGPHRLIGQEPPDFIGQR